MSDVAQELPKKSLPDRLHRELRKGETIYHSALPCHVSFKFPEGKWLGQVRRDERGKLIKYPVKGFGTPREALDYVKSLRPAQNGARTTARQGEPTVESLYEFVRDHRQKRSSERTKAGKEQRWRLYIEPEWGDCPLSQVTRRAAQEWVTTVEGQIERGEVGKLGLSQFDKVRTDLHGLFEAIGSFSTEFEDRKNPFAGLDFSASPPRVKVTIESQYFAALVEVCQRLAAEQLCTGWITEMFLTSLLSGLREGEVLALCRDQLDFRHGAIIVDRAMRRSSRAIDPRTRQEAGPVLLQAMNMPKGGTPSNDKTRVVPMSDQLAAILHVVCDRKSSHRGEWDLLWPSEVRTLRTQARFQKAWQTLRRRLDEIATLAPVDFAGGLWPATPKRQGWIRNSVVEMARANPQLRLPPIFQDIDFRDTRNSFASYTNEVGLSQATREHILGHGGGLTNTVYTDVTSRAHQEARRRLSRGWKLPA